VQEREEGSVVQAVGEQRYSDVLRLPRLANQRRSKDYEEEQDYKVKDTRDDAPKWLRDIRRGVGHAV
jgi:hypothetical protein